MVPSPRRLPHPISRSLSRPRRLILGEEKEPEVNQRGLGRRRPFPQGDRRFESVSLQRGVRCEPGTATTFSFLVGAGLLPYVVEDLVAGLSRNAERATDLAHRFAVQQPSDEPQALVHHRTLLPRHPRLPRKGERCYRLGSPRRHCQIACSDEVAMSLSPAP